MFNTEINLELFFLFMFVMTARVVMPMLRAMMVMFTAGQVLATGAVSM